VLPLALFLFLMLSPFFLFSFDFHLIFFAKTSDLIQDNFCKL
jgi:hypothetical protein